MRRVSLFAVCFGVAAGCAPFALAAGGSENPDASPDANGDGAADTAPDTTGKCPVGVAGPALVDVGAFCIDSTEVTNKQYIDFLSAKGGNVSGQPAVCAWNVTYEPGVVPDPGTPNNPIGSVDWCDAYAYCAWAGKRLCGKIGAGQNAFGDYADPTKSQWFTACSQSGARIYPYGNTYLATTCNTESDAGMVPVASKPGCVGGSPGLFDMTGNMEEWEDSCDPVADGGPEADHCRHRGGAVDDSPPVASCAGTDRALPRNVQTDTGIRCCWP